MISSNLIAHIAATNVNALPSFISCYLSMCELGMSHASALFIARQHLTA